MGRLSRLYCHGCQEETLHNSVNCVHCGVRFVPDAKPKCRRHKGQGAAWRDAGGTISLNRKQRRALGIRP